MIRRQPRSTQSRSSAASDVYKRQEVAADAIRREVAECKKDYDFHEYDELITYNLDAALTDYELDLI